MNPNLLVFCHGVANLLLCFVMLIVSRVVGLIFHDRIGDAHVVDTHHARFQYLSYVFDVGERDIAVGKLFALNLAVD